MDLIRLHVTLVLALVFLVNFQAGASLNSPFSSTVPGLSIPNSHFVSTHNGGMVVRGQAPGDLGLDELLSLGIDRVLIFKNQTQNEVTQEISTLKKKGVLARDILQVDMPWKNITDFQEVCEMTLESLVFIEDTVKSQRSVYFHCTVGEDRTGYLAGLWGLWSGEFRDVRKAFREEMCNRGYEAGDAKKPYAVVKAVRNHLTPAFVKMVQLLSDSRKIGLHLRQIHCPRDIQISVTLPVCR
jgi:hypothetical protein